MSYRLSPPTTHPRVTFEGSPTPLEHDICVFLEARNITTQQGWLDWLEGADAEDMAEYDKVRARVELTIDPPVEE